MSEELPALALRKLALLSLAILVSLPFIEPIVRGATQTCWVGGRL